MTEGKSREEEIPEIMYKQVEEVVDKLKMEKSAGTKKDEWTAEIWRKRITKENNRNTECNNEKKEKSNDLRGWFRYKIKI